MNSYNFKKGFLMNKKSLAENDNFYESVINAQQFVINPLLAKITDINGIKYYLNKFLDL